MSRPRFRSALVLFLVVALAPWFPGWAAAQRPTLDAAGAATPSAAARAQAARLRSDPALLRLGTPASIEERFGVPTFVWAARSAGGAPSGAGVSVDQAARAHVARIAPLYRLDAGDVAAARLRHVHDTGRGGIIATFDQVVDGVEVFRDELRLLMSRDRELIAASGYLPSRGLTARRGARSFRLGAAATIAKAVQDFSGAVVSPANIRRDAALPGGYESYVTSVAGIQPVRIKRVLFHLPDELRPSWYLELIDDNNGYAYVVSADDGEILLRQDLVVNDAYTYRVWGNTGYPYIPMDGPHGDSPTPHPTGLPDGYAPAFIPPNLLSLEAGQISTGDPWLPPGATETTGNNVDAYADLASPDGFTAGDLRASTTSPNTFDRVYDTSLAPGASADQRMAAATQLFYVNNFLHDWYYDDGFDEASGNAQASNYGRGGVEGDRLRAEAQDYAGTNNANMLTPADGASPRMQMYVFTPAPTGSLTILGPPSIAGSYPVGLASFGPTNFSVSGEVVLAVDGTAPVNDGCEAITNSVAGKIVLIDRGACTFVVKVQNAQNAGAIAVIIANNVASVPPPGMSGTSGTIVIPVLSITQELGNSIKAEMAGGPVTATLTRQTPVHRDGTLDNLVVAHEWGHYISNRLVPGLSSNQARGLGEGWGDFHAMLMAVREGDNFGGTYDMAGYATSSYYFGFRRYPYSSDLSRNPLTFQHITNGVPLPVGPPVAFGADGSTNAAVHSTGEVWCSMLWECYRALLADNARLPFGLAQSRMKAYLVAAYKMTPPVPTLTEARDALLAVAYAADPLDFDLFCQAFAKRGAGTGAISPDRWSTDNSGVVESFACGGDLAFVSAAITETNSCDGDGYLDDGEYGEITVTLSNVGSTTLSATTVTLSSANPFVSFPSGAGAAVPSTTPFGTAVVSVPVRLSGAAGIQVVDIQVSYDDPGLLVAGPRVASIVAYGNVDEVPSMIETAEETNSACTVAGVPSGPTNAWRRQEFGPTDHRFFAPDPGSASDQSLITPPLQVAGSGSFSFQFAHRHAFEADGTTYYDGGVLEISTDGGSTWNDIGAAASPGYGGTLYASSGNPLASRPAFVGTSAGYPSLSLVTVDLGTAYAGQTVQLRFRLGADGGVGDYGWDVDDLQVFNVTNVPFVGLIVDPTTCTVAVGDVLPTELAFALVGANPVRRGAQFRFALPEAGHVRIALYDIAGRRVATLADGMFPAGEHHAMWKDRVPGAGVYFARLTTGGKELRRKVVVVP